MSDPRGRTVSFGPAGTGQAVTAMHQRVGDRPVPGSSDNGVRMERVCLLKEKEDVS